MYEVGFSLRTEVIGKHVETEEEFIFNIREAQTELKAGLGISHDDVVHQ
jgi:methanogenic corrinoid protein MtbC1